MKITAAISKLVQQKHQFLISGNIDLGFRACLVFGKCNPELNVHWGGMGDIEKLITEAELLFFFFLNSNCATIRLKSY